MKNILLVTIIVLLFFSCKKTEEPKVTTPEYNPGEGWNQSWSEEFNGTSLNTALWNYDIGTGTSGWGNNELQTCRSENVVLENGNLVITAKSEVYNSSNFTSGRINTKDKYSFKYGKIVGKIKLPEGYGMWPAFWMLGSSAQAWPACGEIDIMEAKGGDGPNGDQTIFSTCHWQNGSNAHQYYGKEYVHTAKLSQDFHFYEVEWNATTITARFDGIQYNVTNITSADVSELKDNAYFIILNIAVGGNIFSPPLTNPANITASFPQKMYVDWIRVYQK